jgi:hypothetical protein
VIDLRLWRISLLGVLATVIVAMFSLQEVPRPLESPLPPDAFDGPAARELAADLGRAAPEPRPGSDADGALADQVRQRFNAIDGAAVGEQRFDAEFGGKDVELRNLIGVLPGESDRQVAVLASRDVASGSGTGTSIAATAELLEIADAFAGTDHRKTLVFVSTDGGSIGALGARHFARDYGDADLLDAVVVLSQPAAPDPEPPLAVPWSTGDESTSATLDETAIAMTSDELEQPAGDESPLQDIARLAIPSAIGDQGPLVESGIDAIRLSSSGELPPEPGTAEADEIGQRTFDDFGRVALSLMLALDAAPSDLDHGPSAYVGLAGNLLPGWTLSLIALALLLAAAVPALAGLATAASSPLQAARAFGWVAWGGAPLLLATVVVYVCSWFGLIPAPDFPFDTAGERLGLTGSICAALAAALALAAGFLTRPLHAPGPRIAPVAAPASVAAATLAGLGIWLVNPYLGLLVALGLQAWVAAAARVGPGRLAAIGLVAAGAQPVLAVVVALAVRFDAGPGVGADLLFMFTGGQLPMILALFGCLLGGSGLAIVALDGPQRPDRSGSDEPGSGEEDAEPEIHIESTRPGRPPPELAPDPEPDADEPAQPGRDPRLWSKPADSSSRPSVSRRTAPFPSLTRPISVSP